MKYKRDEARSLTPGERGLLSVEEQSPGVTFRAPVRILTSGKRRLLLSPDGEQLLVLAQPCLATLTLPRSDGLRMLSGKAAPQANGVIAFSPAGGSLRVQRRRDFRLPMMRVVRVFRVSEAAECSVRATLLDLSAGGALIETADAYAAGERLRCFIPMGAEGFEERVDALVLSCAPTNSVSASSGGRCTVRITFDDDNGRVSMPEAQRDEIARYLFAQQRAMLKLRRLLAPAEETTKRPSPVAELLSKLRGAL